MEIKKGNGVQWVDVTRPTDKDLTWLEKEYKLHPIIVEELRGPSARGRVEAYKDYLYFIYYFPVYDRDDEASPRSILLLPRTAWQPSTTMNWME